MKKLWIVLCLGMGVWLYAGDALPPPFDPYGVKAYKGDIDYAEIRKNTLSYLDKNGSKKNIKTHGQWWRFYYPTKDKTAHKEARIHLDTLFKERGATLLFSDDERTLYTEANATVETYFDLYYGWRSEVRIYEYRSYKLVPNVPKTVTFTGEKGAVENYIFSMPFDGEHYYMMRVDILEGDGVVVDVDADMEDEAVKIRYNTDLTCSQKYYKSYGFYDLDPYKADHTVSIRPIDEKTKVKITLIKTEYKIPPLGKISEKPGIFKLKNSLSALPKMESLGTILGDFPTVGDYLPNGDAVYWLNNGYYFFTKDHLRTNLVPVLANHETTVDWPVYYEEMKRSTSVDGNVSTKMAIYDVSSEENNSVTVNLSLSHLPKEMNLSKEDFSVFEDGNIEGEVLSLKRLHESMNIVILLDSSGSMKKSMKLALRSVHNFIEKLPEDAKVTLVDFDTKVKPLKAKNRKEMLKKLLKIKANGATALYDALIKGTQLLSEKSRASVILFTDGKDANYNDTKRGSKATFDMMIKEVQKNKIPVYPIAFGNGADTTSLMTIANITKTTYYQGGTEEKLNRIFDDIRHTLSSAYAMTYARGKAPKEGSQPVVNYMIDVSGSMDLRYTMYKDCAGCGYRLEPLKAMLVQSVESLPKDTFIQLNTFSSDVHTLQILTQNKAKILAGIGALKIGGGTKIVHALKKGLALSKVLPSSRRYFIFTTDAAGDAFKFDKDEKKEFKATLLAFKRSGIQTFWLGMWKDKTVVKNMEYMAKISGGEAFVSTDIEKIKEKILEVTRKISENNVTQERIGSVMVKVKRIHKKTGVILTAVGEKELDLPLLKEEKTQKKVKEIAYNIRRFKADEASYNENMAATIYGDDLPLKDVRVSKVLSLIDDHNRSIEAHNRAVNIEIPKAYILDRVKGLNAGHFNEFLVLELNISNILPSQKVAVLEDGSKHPSSWVNHENENYKTIDAISPYVIPNLKSHLFIRVNNSYEMPFDPLTWGLSKPLTPIDQFSLTIEGKRSKQGVLLFKIPNKPITSLSLHFYDSAYGHMDIPIIGKMQRDKKVLEKLPKEAKEKLSDAFTLSLHSRAFASELADVKAAKESLFEVLDMQIDSQLDALLKLDPKKRFYLKISDEKGDWMLSPHAVTSRIPMGFYKHIALAPGSHNRVSLAFQIPEKLKDLPQSLIVELKGKDKEIVLDLNKTKKSKGKAKILAKGTAEKIALFINAIHKIEHLDGSSENMLLVDLTLNDEEDGSATRLHSMLVLSNEDHVNMQGRKTAMGENVAGKKGLGGFASSAKETMGSKKFVAVNPKTSSRLLGCDNMVLDGYKKRCLVLFDLDSLDEEKPLYLLSPLFEDLKYEVEPKKTKKLKKEEYALLAKRVVLERSSYMADVERILEKVRHENIFKGKGASGVSKRMVSLDSAKDLPQSISPLPISYVGAQKMASIKSVEDALDALKSITWVPAVHDEALYSSESMFTQGWGSEFEMLQYIYAQLRSKNIEIKAGYYPLTAEGKTKLTEMAEGIPVVRKSVPYLSWTEEGKKKSLVFPFMKAEEEIASLIDISDPSTNSPLYTKRAEMEMKLYYKTKKTDVSMQMGGMGASLSGSEKEEEKSEVVMREHFDLNKVSNMPVDVWFGKGKEKDGKEVVKKFVYGSEGIEGDNLSLSSSIVPKRLEVKLYDGEKYLDTYTFRFKEGQKLEDLFFTFSFAMPDLSEEVLALTEEVRQKKFKNIKNIEPLSKLQWINRAKIYKFIGLQTKYEQELQHTLDVKVKRNKTPRTIMAMLEKTPDNTLISSLDLRSVWADAYGEEGAVKSFNAMSGLLATESEGKSVPEGKTVFTLWDKAKDLRLLTVLPEKKKEAMTYMKKQNVPKWILERLEDSDRVWIFPSKSIDEKYGWLEIDPESMSMLSVLDNGQYSAMTETVITQENIETTTRYFLGLLIGGNIAVGSVINYSLLGYESFDEIKKRSEKLAKVLGCYVKKFESVSGDVIGTAKGAAKDELKKQAIGGTGDAIENMINSTFDCKNGGSADSKDPEKYKDFVNFGKGIDHAISQYFKNMK